jgi:hypothetical protein
VRRRPVDQAGVAAVARSRRYGSRVLASDTLAGREVATAHTDPAGTTYLPVGGGKVWRVVRVEPTGHTRVLVGAHNRDQACAYARALAAVVITTMPRSA